MRHFVVLFSIKSIEKYSVYQLVNSRFSACIVHVSNFSSLLIFAIFAILIMQLHLNLIIKSKVICK